VVTGVVADKEGPAYRRCEDEPIQTPGAIQSFGALIGLKYSKQGQLEVRIASENTRKVLGYGPEQLFALPSFLDVLKHDVRDEIVARIHQVLKSGNETMDETRLDVFRIILTFPYEPETRLWCAIHLSPNVEGLVICEFEAYSDAFYLKDAGDAQIVPVTPVRLGNSEASAEDLKKSTTSLSKPLPVIEVARKKQNKEFSTLDVFNAMTQAQKQIAACTTVQAVFDVVVGIIAELTGFHRVMFYRFDSQKNGCVEAELLNPNASTDVYRGKSIVVIISVLICITNFLTGLHYPASDIPKQARKLYIINRIRVLHDRDAPTARLVSDSCLN
jgi:light-regulated signal transduction histidine kinase (bacteriophytochrome)